MAKRVPARIYKQLRRPKPPNPRARGRFIRCRVKDLKEGDYVWLPAVPREGIPEEYATVVEIGMESEKGKTAIAEVDRLYRGRQEDGLRELADDSPIYLDTW